VFTGGSVGCARAVVVVVGDAVVGTTALGSHP